MTAGPRTIIANIHICLATERVVELQNRWQSTVKTLQTTLIHFHMIEIVLALELEKIALGFKMCAETLTFTYQKVVLTSENFLFGSSLNKLFMLIYSQIIVLM